jgi:hypothetical protein
MNDSRVDDLLDPFLEPLKSMAMYQRWHGDVEGLTLRYVGISAFSQQNDSQQLSS